MSDTSERQPDVRGILSKTPVAHLLVYAVEKRLTGSFCFSVSSTEEAILRTVHGRVTKAWTRKPVALLGAVLEELGCVTSAQLEDTRVQLTGEGGLHGQILLEKGIITARQLHDGLAMQLDRKLAHIFALPPGAQFSYYADLDLLDGYGGAELPDYDMLPTLWRGICLRPPWEQVDSTLTKFVGKRLQTHEGVRLDRFRFERDVADSASILVTDAMAVDEFVRESGLSVPTARLLLYCLILTKQVFSLDRPEASHKGAVHPQTATPSGLELAFQPSNRVGGMPQVPARPSLSFQAVRPTTRSMPAISAPEAQSHGRATTRPASASSEMRAVSPSTSAMPAASRPVTLPNFQAQAPVHRPSGSMALAPLGAQGRSTGIPPAASVEEEHMRRRTEIRDFGKSVDRLNYFQMLGLRIDAQSEDVEAAFLRLAKVWHPDRLPTALSDVREICTHIIVRLNEAYRTLRDPMTRERYLPLVRQGNASPEGQIYLSRVQEAATHFRSAEQHLIRADAQRAEADARRAYELDPTQADYLALLAWVESMKPEAQSPEILATRISMLDRAVAMGDRCERALFFRAMLYKRVGKHSAAVADLQRALAINPRAHDVASELRMLTRRGEVDAHDTPQKSSGKGENPISGLWKNLLKRD